MSKITEKDLKNRLKEYDLNENHENFIFGYKQSKLIAASPLAALLTKMAIFGFGENEMVIFQVTVSGELKKIKPEILTFPKDLSAVEFKKGILSHTFYMVQTDGKKLSYKINRMIIPYPWHNESVKKLFEK